MRFFFVFFLFYLSHAVAEEPPLKVLKDLTWNKTQLLLSVNSKVTDTDNLLISKYRNVANKTSFSSNNKEFFDTAWRVISDDSYSILSCRRPESVKLTQNVLVLNTMKYSRCLNGKPWSTGYIASEKKYKYGFFEAKLKITDITGINNAFWLLTSDGYEIDIAEVHYPNNVHITLHKWEAGVDHAYARNLYFNRDFSKSFHEFGLLWLPNRLIFAIDGKTVVAFNINDDISGMAEIRLSTALTPFAGRVDRNPEGRKMEVSSIKIVELQ